MPDERVTVTLPRELVDAIDRLERNRSRFVREAIRNELANRRAEALRRSLSSPHPESAAMADLGLEDWVSAAPAGDLIDPQQGRRVEWRPGAGWSETDA